MARNPYPPSRYKRNKYLGKRVKDTGKPGLDNLSEVERICKAILQDYKKGRISRKTANGRFARLHNAIIKRDSDFKNHPRKMKKALQIIEKYWAKL